MPDDMDLTREIATAVDGAAARGHTLALGYIDDDGYPATSFRGSTQVHGPAQFAIWVRNPGDGFARAIATRPNVTLAYYGPGGPDPFFLSIRGHARIDATANDEVYAAMIEGEQQQDRDRKGVAVVIDVQTVRGFGSGGGFQLDGPAAGA